MGLESESQINLGHLPALTQATSAAIGSVISNAIVYPLDLVTTRMQTRRLRKSPQRPGLYSMGSEYSTISSTSSSRKNRPQNYDDLISSFRTIISQSENRSPSQFYEDIRNIRVDIGWVEAIVDEILMGSFTGIVSKFFTCPLNNITIRLQTCSSSKRTGIRRRSAGISGECTVVEVQDGRLTESDSSSSSGEEDDEDRSRKESYFSHLSRTIRSIYEDRGYLGFWSGFGKNCILTINPSLTLYLTKLIKRLTNPSVVVDQSVSTTFMNSAIASNNDSLVARYRRFGIAALYTGLQPKLLKVCIGQGITMSIKIQIEAVFVSLWIVLVHRRRRHYLPSTFNTSSPATKTKFREIDNIYQTKLLCQSDTYSRLFGRTIVVTESELDRTRVSIVEKSDLEGALLKYEESIRMVPSSTGYYNLGIVLYQLRRIPESIELANQLDPTDPEICFNLGAVNEANGNLVDALAEYTRAKQLGVERAEQNIRNSPVLRIPIEPGHCLVFGRKPDLRLLSNEINNKSSTILPITLPKSFTHASRTHCLCTLIAPPLGGLNIRIVVKGQNGLMVDGERFEEGSSAGVELERRDGEQIELGFYGGKKVECYVKIDDHLNTRVRSRPTTTTTTTSTTRAGKRKALSTTTIKTQKLKGNNHQPETQPAIESDQEQQPNKRYNNTIPTTEEGRNLTTEERIRRLIESMGLDLLGMIASAVVFSSRATVSTSEVIRSVLETQPSLAESILAILPSSSSSSSPDPTPLIDINPKLEDELEEHTGLSLSNRRTESGLLNPSPSPSLPHPINTTTTTTANTTSNNTNTVSEIERVVHFCKPIFIHTLKNHSKVNGTGMFGCVSNEGLKDASGEPLENLWYYQAQFDSDLERKLNLQPYVRHIRHTQTTSKQYFFKKVRGNGRRKS
ncbi:hypothetical protein H4Q26_001393 [Puccinia striiformis f. sp. tritici PST-130]|nr:hypothetical protein H4Q26_001393 [Puccinia striiformis f. sp. tritici PST-130]